MRTRWQLMVAVLFCLITGFTVRAQTAQGPDKPGSILVVGDSLSAEYGLQRGSGWVNLIQQRLDAAGLAYRVNNASISGDTTSGGLSRLADALVRYHPDIVIIELGSNDALRGLSLDMTRGNLANMVRQAKATGSTVVLVGMQIPPNYGRQYTEAFKQLFVDLAQSENLALVPFLLEGIAADRSLFQADGIHPNESAQPVLAENVWKALAPLVAAKP
ncbi:MAG: arylesterase [Pusillimonas sp.]